ncbi:hypothetical protein TNCV_4290901 [Trichonephila clavipes]|nr:hypothetical protein TNCV_4290901 [Trichonephila clavipes]
MSRSIESETFAADHVCHSNFQGSALKMEAVGATRSSNVLLSNEALNMHIIMVTGTLGFISVKDTYGKNSVTKYECISHVSRCEIAQIKV